VFFLDFVFYRTNQGLPEWSDDKIQVADSQEAISRVSLD
jgi:hypothetical protein